MDKKCYYYDNTKIDEPAQIGIDWLYTNAKNKNYFGVWLAVNVIENLHTIAEYDTSLTVLNQLDNPSYEYNIYGIHTKLILDTNIPVDGNNIPLLAIHPTRRYLSELDRIPNITEMMVIPFGNEIDDWIKINQAVLLGDETNGNEDMEQLDPFVISELEEMTRDFNSSNYDNVEATARKLLENGYNFDPFLIRNYLIKKLGWGPGNATLAMEFMSRVRDNIQGRT